MCEESITMVRKKEKRLKIGYNACEILVQNS